MKMNKKGFTLIELLAVIVILAIILLIATPVILGVVEKARYNAARNSALSFVNAVEQQVIINELEYAAGDDTISRLYNTKINYNPVTLRGDQPSTVSLEISDGQIVDGLVKFGTYTFTLTNGEVKSQ